MNVTVHSLHFDADSKLIDFIKEKLNKLTLFHDSILAGDVTLRVGPDGERPQNKHAEIRLSVPGNDLFAKRKAVSFEEAVVNTIEALRNQVEKDKAKLRVVRG